MRANRLSFRVSKHTERCERTATHCNTLQHTATHCNTLQHTYVNRHSLLSANAHEAMWMWCNTLQHTAAHMYANRFSFRVPTHTEREGEKESARTRKRQNDVNVCNGSGKEGPATHYNNLQHTTTHNGWRAHTRDRKRQGDVNVCDGSRKESNGHLHVLPYIHFECA